MSTTRFSISLRWSLYVAHKSPKGGLKNAKRPISVKNALRLKKVCYKVSLCENCQRQSCKAFIGLTNRAKMFGEGATPSTWNFESKWPRWSQIWTTSCDNSETVEIGCQLLLITNRKSHTGIRLVPTSMTLNDLESRNSPYFAFFSRNSTDFAGRLYHSGWR